MTQHSMSPLRQRMIEDMSARKLTAGTQSGHLRGCRRFAAFLKGSPDTTGAEDIRRFQLHLAQSGVSISSRNRTMTGLRFLFRVRGTAGHRRRRVTASLGQILDDFTSAGELQPS